MSYTFCLTVTVSYHNLKEHKDMMSFFLFLNPDFDSLPNDEKWTFASTLNDPSVCIENRGSHDSRYDIFVWMCVYLLANEADLSLLRIKLYLTAFMIVCICYACEYNTYIISV